MDAKRYYRFQQFVARLISFVGADAIEVVHYGPGDSAAPYVQLGCEAFNRVCCERQVSQASDGEWLHRTCRHGDFELLTLIRIPSIPPSVIPGERVDFFDDDSASVLGADAALCDEDEADTVLYTDAGKAVMEQSS